MIGIIDGGGGLRDIYGAGVFDRLMDDGVKLDYCLGVSAGSANLASYLAGQRGRNHRFYIDYSKRKEYMSFGNFLRKGAFLDLHYIYGTLSNSDGEDPLDYEAMVENPAQFVVVATDANTGAIHYFDKKDVPADDYRVLMASSAIPIAARFEWIGDRLCADGGVGEPIPIEKAFADGCDKVVLVLSTFAEPMQRKRRDLVGSILLKHTYPAIADLLSMRHEVFNHQLRLVQRYVDEGKCLIVCPDDLCGIKTLTNETDSLEMLYQKGYDDAAKIRAFVEE